MKYLSALILGTGFLFFSPLVADETLIQHLHSKVLDTIENVPALPGIKPEQLTALKTNLAHQWNELVEKGVLEVNGTDKEIRPYFGMIQSAVELVLASELEHEVCTVNGFIHTPMPATPLCTTGEISPELVDPSMEKDPLRLFTVKARATTLRELLSHGATLHIVYPQGGLQKRTAAQQEIYLNELNNYPDNLIDFPINCEAIDPDLIGATYLFTDADGQKYIFAIAMTQANDPREEGHFGLWFGRLENPLIFKHVSAVKKFITAHAP